MNDPLRSAGAGDLDLLERPEAPNDGDASFVSRLDATKDASIPVERDEPTVREVMTANVHTCRADRTLVAAAAAMQRGDCRFLPVVDEAGRPIAVITDGDICEIGTTDQRPLREILVSEAMTRTLFTCRPEDGIRRALETMKRRRVRHLPVVDAEGRLAGVVSLTDVILRVEEGEQEIPESLRREIAEVLRAVSQKERGTRAVRVNPFRED
jgi:CBS domain-containing protein